MALVLGTAVVTTTGPRTPAADAAPRPAPAPVDATVERLAPRVPPPSQRVYVVADSVGLGARSAIPAAFPADWQVVVDGEPARFVEQLEQQYVRSRLVTNPWWFGDHVVVAGGYNYPYWDPARFDRSIDSMIATLRGAGVEHIYWVTVREIQPQYVTTSAWNQALYFSWYLPTVNEHLRRAAQRHPDLTLIDWAAAANRTGITYDAIHLNTTGAALYAGLVRDAVESNLAARRVGPDVPLPATTAPASRYLPLPASRVLDTRVAGSTRPGAGTTLTVDLSDAIPEGATAVAVNLTAVAPDGPGHLGVRPCGGGPAGTSAVNHAAGATRAAMTIATVGADRRLCVRTHAAGHVIVDLQGVFVPPTSATEDALGLDPVVPARRLVDTRSAGRAATVRVAAPSGAAAVAVNLTAVGAARAGHLTAWSCDGTVPRVSSVNFGAREPVAGAAFVPVGSTGEICVTASHPDVDLIVDLTGRFSPAGRLSFVPVVGTRVLDTRNGTGGWSGAHGHGQTLDVRGTPTAAEAVSGTVTLVGPRTDSHLTVFGCGTAPRTSNVNASAGGVLANHVTTAVSDTGRVCLFSPRRTHTLFDVTGWWIP
jgi:hypothetical protein